jgi:uncharacterized protein (TIGR02569 family)
MQQTPPVSVLRALGVSGNGQGLRGGQGQATLFGDLVLKPCDNAVQWTGLAPLLASLSPVGYRIARPVRFPDGRWVLDGWMATERLEGAPGYAGREPEALAACKAIHSDLRGAYRSAIRPDWLSQDDSCYAKADLIAWQDASPDDYVDECSCRVLKDLIGHVRPLGDLGPQITHGDPGGDNVLFSEHAPPGIIDFSPYWRPSGYAIAMMLADGIAWERSDPETLNLAADQSHIGQLLLRAVVFRLAVSALIQGPSRLDHKRKAYDPVIRWVITNDNPE